MSRFAISTVIATIVVLTMLVLGLKVFQREPELGPIGMQSFEVEYLTPEEASELLGEEAKQFRVPDAVTLPPAPPVNDREPGDDDS